MNFATLPEHLQEGRTAEEALELERADAVRELQQVRTALAELILDLAEDAEVEPPLDAETALRRIGVLAGAPGRRSTTWPAPSATPTPSTSRRVHRRPHPAGAPVVTAVEEVDRERREASDRATAIATSVEDVLLLVGRRVDITACDDAEHDWTVNVVRRLARALVDAQALGRYLDDSDADRVAFEERMREVLG